MPRKKEDIFSVRICSLCGKELKGLSSLRKHLTEIHKIKYEEAI